MLHEKVVSEVYLVPHEASIADFCSSMSMVMCLSVLTSVILLAVFLLTN